MIDMAWLERLIRLVEDSDIDSLEIERLTSRVRIRKTPQGVGLQVAPASAAPAIPAGHAPEAVDDDAPPSAAQAAASAAQAASAAAEAASAALYEVLSPMVGTFYRSPSPDSPPFVSVGDHVDPGQTLCILEAMKLMNELESEVGGTIREILVENGEPVEYGQVLFRIDPD